VLPALVRAHAVWIGGERRPLQHPRARRGPTLVSTRSRSADAPAPLGRLATITDITTIVFRSGPSSPLARRLHGVLDALGESGATSGPAWRESPGTTFDIDARLVGGNDWRAPDGSIHRARAGIEDARAIAPAASSSAVRVRDRGSAEAARGILEGSGPLARRRAPAPTG
jgi:hypothetical protein